MTSLVLGQRKLVLPKIDTINLDYRSGGNPLEYIDVDHLGVINLRPAAGFAQIYEHNLAENVYNSPAGFTYFQNEKRVTPKKTPLPYLGFKYGFGAGLNQAVDADYHHLITKKSHIHFRYHRRTSEGLMRESSFRLNDVNLMIHHQSDRWRTFLDAYYGGYNYDENGGVEPGAVVGVQTVDFLPVNKTNASSETRKVDVKWRNYYDLYRDSLIAHGPATRSHYELTGREFRESPVDNSTFPDIFIDSNSTRDQFQTPSISNGVGYFFSSNILEVDGTLNYRYWRNQNLGTYRDTSEMFLHSNLYFGGERFNIQNEFYFNTLGALGEFYNRSKVFFKPLKKTYISGNLNFDNLLPLPYQRFHFANNIQWELEELQTQQIINIGGRIQYGDTNFIYADLNWTNVNNGLYFINQEWRQDVLDFVSVGAFSIGGELHVGNWHFYPETTVRFNTENFAYQPLFSARMRSAYKKGYFKNDALVLAFGLDLGFDSEHDHLIYNTLLNVMEPGQSPRITPSLYRINFFLGAEIDTFRFFIRAENIDYFINPQDAFIDPNFPITPFIIRLGVTWDFFN